MSRPNGSLIPSTVAILSLLRKGVRPKDVAAQLDVRANVVRAAAANERRRGGAVPDARRAAHNNDDSAMDMTGERCRCGLRLPCNNCVGDAAAFANQRREHWSDTGGDVTKWSDKRKRAA